MNKLNKSALFWVPLSLLLLFLVFGISPGLAQSRDLSRPPAPNTLFNCTWTSAAVVPIPILDNAVASVGGNLYSFGGVSNGVIVATSFKFDGTTWTTIAPYPVALEYPTAVTNGTDIYILGGSDGGGVSQTLVYRYNTASNTYTQLASMSVATWNQTAVYLNGKIYKFCGSANTVSTNAMEIYDIGANTWTPGATYPMAESFVNGFALGNFIYAGGGISSATNTATAKTYRYDPGTNTWDDASIADFPETRWGAACALYTDGVFAGGYVNGIDTANLSPSVISWDVASNTWQTVPNMLGERARMNGAVLNGSFYVVGGRSIASSAFNGENSNQKLTCINVPTNIITSGGSAISSAGPNNVLDPGETVTVSFGAVNSGGPGVICTTAGLTGTLQAGGGVISPSGAQNYGMLCTGSGTEFRDFTFTVDPALPCGSTVTASIVMTDGATNYGTLNYSFVTGNLASSFTENFDGVTAPALPAGWTTTFSGGGTAVGTSTTLADTAPNDAYLSEAAVVSLSELISPAITLPSGASKLSFRNLFNTESGFDGLVLEMSVDGAAFQDILAAGGTFASGGYNSTLSTGFMNPLPGRMAWTGLSGGTAAAPTYITTLVNLPASAGGHVVQFKWRQGSDSSVVATGIPGSRIDTVSVFSPACGTTAPVPTSAVSRKTHGAAGAFDVNLPSGPITGPIGIECRSGTPGQHQVVITFSSPVTLGGATVSTGVGSVTSTVAGPVVTLNLTGVANAQRLGLTLMNVTNGTNLGNVIIPMGVLAGDVNANASVTGSDVSQTKANTATGTVTAGTFRTDVNVNGAINASDVSVVKSVSGTVLP